MDNGLTRLNSSHSVAETIEKIEAALRAAGITIFARVDHSGEAEKAGLKMRPTQVLIFGSPKAGTPLMIAAPSLAIDLPLKALVAEDADGKVSVTYNSPQYLMNRHSVPAELIEKIAGPGALLKKAIEA
jgi:uncharacterized protein (DUF302 family)